MARKQKRKRLVVDDVREGDVDENNTPSQSAAGISINFDVLPKSVLLTLRRDLAIGSFKDALNALQKNGAHRQTATQLQSAGDIATVNALMLAFRPKLRCWSYSALKDTVVEARNSLRSLLPPAREDLLSALHSDDPFCGVIKKRMGRVDSRPLQKLGRPLAMWLLGAAADDPKTLEQQAGSSDTKRRKGNDGEAVKEEVMEDAVVMEDVSDAAPKRSKKKKKAAFRVTKTSGKDLVDDDSDGDGDAEATDAFLKGFRKGRKVGSSVSKEKHAKTKAMSDA